MEEMKGNRSVREVDKEYDFVFIFRGRARRRAWQWASANVATGSEGGTRASGDARRLRKIRSSPPSFAARSNTSLPPDLGFDRFDPRRWLDVPRAMVLLVQKGITRATRLKKKKKNVGRARLSCFMVSSKRESHLQVHLPSMDVSLLGRWRNVCEPFRNREYGVLAGTMSASFHFAEFVVVDTELRYII